MIDLEPIYKAAGGRTDANLEAFVDRQRLTFDQKKKLKEI